MNVDQSEHKELPRASLSQGLAFVLTGAGIGWLMGLSVSPVAHAVITALLALAGGAVSVGASNVLGRDAGPRGNAWPMALLILGIAMGAPAGIWTRVTLSVPVHAEAATAPTDTMDPATQPAAPTAFGLMGDSLSRARDCARLLTAAPADLRFSFRSADDRVLRTLGDAIDDTALLGRLRDSLCAPP